MRRSLPALLAAGLLGAAGPAGTVEASSALAARLKARLSVPALEGARVSALVVERRDGGVLFARDPDRALVPASNLKVLTGLAALAAWGPAHRFSTEIWTDAPPDASGGVEVLTVRGGGDPVLTSERLWRLAADLRIAGLRRIRGELRVDDTLFDDVRWHPSWGDTSARAYHAPVGALMANYGAFQVSVRPAVPGSPAAVSLDPPVPYLRLRGHVVTRRGGRSDLQVRRLPADGGEDVRVGGAVAAGTDPEAVWRSVVDPGLYAGAVLRMQLEANGIRVDGPVRRAPLPAGSHLLHTHEGAALAEICRLFLKYSNNVIAESLVKSLAVRRSEAATPGSWDAGVQAVREVLGGLGLDLRGFTAVDGSGLSREDRVPVRLLVDALRRADGAFGFGPEFEAALPVAASDGTLERRTAAAAGAVRAKTGLLSGVTGLSGFARDGAGRDLVFSVLVNGYAGSDGAAMDALDGFVAALVH